MDQQRDVAAGLRAQMLALAAAFHKSLMAYWNDVVVPRSKVLERAPAAERKP